MTSRQVYDNAAALIEKSVIIAADLFALFVCFRLARLIRLDILPLVYAGFPEGQIYLNILTVWWIFLVWVFFLYYEGLYTKRHSFWDEIGLLWRVAFFSTVGVLTIVSLGKLSSIVSRTTVILMGVLSLCIIPIVRVNVKRLLYKFGRFRRRVLILGAGETGRMIRTALGKESNLGYDVIGFLDDDPSKAGMKVDGLKVHPGVDRAVSYLRAGRVSDIIIAMPGAGKERIQNLINTLQHQAQRILYVPDMHGIAVLGTSLLHFFHEQAFAIELKNNLARPVNFFMKRCFDILACIILLPFLLVPMGVIAVLIRRDSEGAAIYTQERMTRYGRLFRCYKFRTMYLDSDERLASYLAAHPEARDELEEYWKLKNDPRVTKIGKFLRATSLDELPQILNVLRGEMSFVGPRPYLPEEQEGMGEEAATILKGIPGITGLWQVSGRSKTSYRFRMSLDAWYIRNWNLWLDIVILFKTVGVVIRREGAW